MKTPGKLLLLALGILLSLPMCSHANKKSAGSTDAALFSIDTKYTIMKVRTAVSASGNYIVASSYEGILMGIGYDGNIRWKKELSGFLNHDLWCEDITGDGVDEVMAANADGTLYCLDSKGKLLWKFKSNDAPMYSVCVINHQKTPYVVCGGYDKSMYYLSGEGGLIKEIPSSGYSIENPWQPYVKSIPDSNCHLANFIRKIHKSNGTEILAVHGVIHTMAIQARGSVYLFDPLEEKPYRTVALEKGRPLGEFRSGDVNHDGTEEILMGTSNMLDASIMLQLNPTDGEQTLFKLSTLANKIDRFGYRVVQPEIISSQGEDVFFILFGSRILLVPLDLNETDAEVLACKYSFNDMWNDRKNGKIVLASVQSGGSCIHIIDTKDPDWKEEYSNLEPEGKISEILKNTAVARSNLRQFEAPEWASSPRPPVYLMSESIPRSLAPLADDIKANYKNPVFLNSAWTNKAENWDRSGIKNERYRNRRDNRRKYEATSEEIVNTFVPRYKNAPGLAFWGGHGNDPYMFQLSTTKKILDHAEGKKTVLIFPELEDHSENFAYVMDDYFYPLADYCREKNGMIYVRTKHTFWQANAYLPMWSGLLSGEYSEVFIPAMEETTDKSMELSIAARLGVWTSGAVDSWGTRCARDNPSFDRLRQHSHQMLPNHFLRTMVYHVSHGAQYLDNFAVDQEYMSMLWELIASGALYVPERSEIVSFSPVHLSMLDPDEDYMDRSNNVKWTTFFDQKYEEENPMVFSRLSGSWPGAPVTEWDFSRYAAGVSDRRQNFLPPCENGLVLITPPQSGFQAAANPPRGKLTDHLNPIYKDIMKKYYTDGRNYYSADGKQKFLADEYYKTIEEDIKNSAELLPLTVSGDVAWVVSQTSPTNLRLTIVDGGYINPDSRTARISFHAAEPVKMVDILDGEEFDLKDPGAVMVNIPCGMFRFIDIELNKPL
ncbi:hypothetical protein ACFLTA_07145 [Bacteroidota bacterium]